MLNSFGIHSSPASKMSDKVHIVPEEDSFVHDLWGTRCDCGPTIEFIRWDDSSIGWAIRHKKEEERGKS